MIAGYFCCRSFADGVFRGGCLFCCEVKATATSLVQTQNGAGLSALENRPVSHKSLILVCTLLVGSVASSALDERPFEEDSFPGMETPAGKMLEKRIMAQALIDHGVTELSPESILVGVQILHQNPVANAQPRSDQKSSVDEILDLKGLVELAIEMRPDDKILVELASQKPSAFLQRAGLWKSHHQARLRPDQSTP